MTRCPRALGAVRRALPRRGASGARRRAAMSETRCQARPRAWQACDGVRRPCPIAGYVAPRRTPAERTTARTEAGPAKSVLWAPASCRAGFSEAAGGTRTLDLLHGKQTLIVCAHRFIPAYWPHRRLRRAGVCLRFGRFSLEFWHSIGTETRSRQMSRAPGPLRAKHQRTSQCGKAS
jgi:hypothetical protein